MSTVPTEFGDKSLEEVVRVYNMVKRRESRASQRRTALLQSNVELQEKNRERAKTYYEKNKDLILEKRKAWYMAWKETQNSTG